LHYLANTCDHHLPQNLWAKNLGGEQTTKDAKMNVFEELRHFLVKAKYNILYLNVKGNPKTHFTTS